MQIGFLSTFNNCNAGPDLAKNNQIHTLLGNTLNPCMIRTEKHSALGKGLSEGETRELNCEEWAKLKMYV